MPLSEVFPAARRKHGPFQQNMAAANCSSDPTPLVPEQEFVELLWENGQIVMQGQSNRAAKSSSPTALPSFAGKAQERDGSRVASRYGSADSAGKDFHAVGSLGQLGFGGGQQDSDMAPWASYPIEDYCLEFLSEFSAPNPSSLPATVPASDRCISYGEAALPGENGGGARGSGQFFSPPEESLPLFPRIRSKDSEFSPHQLPGGDLQAGKTQRHEQAPVKVAQPICGPGLANFSHFLRPSAAQAKAAAVVAEAAADLPNFDVRAGENASTAASSNPLESTLINPTSCSRSFSQFHAESAPGSIAWADLDGASAEQSGGDGEEDNSRLQNQIDSASNPRPSAESPTCKSSSFTGGAAADKHSEPVVASPSICSASDAGAAPNDAQGKGKRKNQDAEDSVCHSEDLEDDSAEAKKPSPGSKRSRAAEVHNLSERRRRDRINEKMRALQELIPNCNKVDKASVLDEAIEYLKTLQMQLQIMSMGGGIYMPPMMVPAGIRAPHMAPFPPMGLGMGMGMGMGMGVGMGFGMGMVDANGSPLVPAPPPPQYPCASVPATVGLRGTSPCRCDRLSQANRRPCGVALGGGEDASSFATAGLRRSS